MFSKHLRSGFQASDRVALVPCQSAMSLAATAGPTWPQLIPADNPQIPWRTTCLPNFAPIQPGPARFSFVSPA